MESNKPISNRMPAVDVEYDHNGQRVRKSFPNAYAARRFYSKKLAAGKNPAVKKAETDD